jgi:hypothetical protein
MINSAYANPEIWNRDSHYAPYAPEMGTVFIFSPGQYMNCPQIATLHEKVTAHLERMKIRALNGDGRHIQR